MSAETAALAVTPHPLGKPGGPGLFRDASLSLPPYVQNIAHSLMAKRGMDKSRAISTAIGVVRNWASGRGNVRPEVKAAASAALAQWEAARAKAKATPNKGEVTLSQPMTLLRSVLDGTQEVALARPAEDTKSQKPDKAKAAKKDKESGEQKGKHQLPPGAVGWRHNWVPVDENGQPVGPSQKDKSASEIKDMVGHTEATKDAIRQAYANKARKDGEKAAKKAKAKAESDARKAKSKAEAAARKKASEKKAAARKAESKKKADAAAAKREATAKTKARQKLVSEATRQALTDKKAGRTLTPTQERLLAAYEKQSRDRAEMLRNDVTLSQPMQLLHTVLAATEPVDLAAPGSRGYIYTHGWKLRAGVKLPNKGLLPKDGSGKTVGHKVIGRSFVTPEISKAKAGFAPAKKTAPAKKAGVPLSGGTPEQTAVYTKAKQAKTAAFHASSAATKLHTAPAHEKAAQAMLEAFKANQTAGLKGSANASLEGAHTHWKKAQALGAGGTSPESASDAPFSVGEEIQIETAAHKLADVSDSQFAAMEKQHGNASSASTRQQQLRAEAIKRAKQLRALSLSNLVGPDTSFGSVPTGSSQDGPRMTVNSLLAKTPRRRLADAALSARNKRRSRRKVGQ